MNYFKKTKIILCVLLMICVTTSCGIADQSKVAPLNSSSTQSSAEVYASNSPQAVEAIGNVSDTTSPSSSKQVDAISSEATQNQPIDEKSVASSPASQSKVLVAYFSWAENAVLASDVDAIASPSVIAPGNVAQLAGWIQEQTGGEGFSIKVIDPYSSDWDQCLERANQEKSDNARPKLMELEENIKDYDVIFLGYPNWWYTAPMAIFSFLETHDLTGKTIYLFCSHGTGGLARSVQDITAALPGGSISDNVFDVNENDVSSSKDAITKWLSGLGY